MKNAIKLIAEQLVGKNKIIKAKPNSIFEFIDLCQHDNEKITEVAKTISVKLENEMDLFRNKLNPLMLEIEKLIKDNVEKYTPVLESSKYKVVEFDMPIVVTNLKSSGLLPNKSREPRTIQDEQLHIPTPDKLDLEKYLELDTPTTTDGLRVELGKYSDEALLQMWEDYLGNISASNTKLMTLFTNPIANITPLLTVFTFLYNLNKNKPSTVTATDDKYFGIVKYVLDEIANTIVYADELFNSGRTRGILVVGYTDEGYTIQVDEKLYQTFIGEGNSPEILLGLAVSDNKNDVEYIFYNKIVENRQFFIDAWTKKLRLEHYAESIKTVSTYKSVYSIIIKEAYNLVPNDLQDLLEVDENQARMKLEEKLATEKDSEIVNPIYMAREIVGYVLFENTNFHKFTHYAMEISKLNPDFTSKELFNFSIVQMLLDYLTDQVVLENA